MDDPCGRKLRIPDSDPLFTFDPNGPEPSRAEIERLDSVLGCGKEITITANFGNKMSDEEAWNILNGEGSLN